MVGGGDLPGHVVNDGGEVGGSVQTHRLETLVIGLHYPLDPAAVGVLRVAVLQTKPLIKKQSALGKSSKRKTKDSKHPELKYQGG